MAAQDARQRESQPAAQAKLADGLFSVARTTGIIATVRTQKGAEAIPIGLYKLNDEGFHSSVRVFYLANIAAYEPQR